VYRFCFGTSSPGGRARNEHGCAGPLGRSCMATLPQALPPTSMARAASSIFNLHSWLFTPEQSRSVKTRGCNRLHIELGVRTANEMLPSPIWFSGSGVSSGLPCTDLNSSRAGKGNNLAAPKPMKSPNLFPVIDIPSPLLTLADPSGSRINTSKEHKQR
jgi:hypothetical protein